jgi:hypothetical protein
MTQGLLGASDGVVDANGTWPAAIGFRLACI